MTPLAPRLKTYSDFEFVGHDADGVGARGGDQLDAEHAEAARGAPHQHIVAGLEDVRRMAEQHAIGGRERERVAGRLFPGQMRRLRHELARLHAAELRERAVRRLVAPDALRRRQQRIAAVALLVVAVVLVAVDDDLVADLPALDLGADGPHDARGVRAGDVKRMLVAVERRYRNAEPGPHAVIVDAARHHIDQHFVLGDRPGRHHLAQHRRLRRTVPFLADRPGIHLRRHVAERRDFADLVEVLQRRGGGFSLRDGHARLSASGALVHSLAYRHSRRGKAAAALVCCKLSLPYIMLQRNNYFGQIQPG